MTHWLIAPVVLPAMLAPFIVLAARYHIGIQRVFSIAGVLTLIAIAAGWLGRRLTARSCCTSWAIGPRLSASFWSGTGCRR